MADESADGVLLPQLMYQLACKTRDGELSQ